MPIDAKNTTEKNLYVVIIIWGKRSVCVRDATNRLLSSTGKILGLSNWLTSQFNR